MVQHLPVSPSRKRPPATAALAILIALSGCNLHYNVIEENNPAPDGGMSNGTAGAAGIPNGMAGSAGATGADAMVGAGIGGIAGTGIAGMSGTGTEPLSFCSHGGLCAELQVTARDSVDVLFVVDNSNSMQEEQERLRAQFPAFVNTLTTGDLDGDGVEDFASAKSVHLGVVSTDMGLVGIASIPGCQGLGDDGMLQGTPSPEIPGCSGMHPSFLTYESGLSDPSQLSTDLTCVATLGTGGCGFEQQLESTLKALWPEEDSRVTFLPDVNGDSASGRGGNGINSGFLREDSVLAIVLLTDEDDCSYSSNSHLVPANELPPNDPRAGQGLNTRCHFESASEEPNNLYDITRYVAGLRALREGREQDVVLAAIAGVPPALVAMGPGTDDPTAFYDGVLESPEMQEVIDTRANDDPMDDNLVPACESSGGKAYPARRITQVVQGFGDGGVLRSICEEDFGPTIAAITQKIASRLGNLSCLSQPLEKTNDQVACEVIWQLPPANTAPMGTPTECGQGGFDFLSATMRVGSSEGALCSVAQVPIDPMGNLGMGEGFYYDDFSSETVLECAASSRARIAFTPGAKPPAGVNVYLDCDP